MNKVFCKRKQRDVTIECFSNYTEWGCWCHTHFFGFPQRCFWQWYRNRLEKTRATSVSENPTRSHLLMTCGISWVWEDESWCDKVNSVLSTWTRQPENWPTSNSCLPQKALQMWPALFTIPKAPDPADRSAFLPQLTTMKRSQTAATWGWQKWNYKLRKEKYIFKRDKFLQLGE